jgi:hypothetical protein
MSPFLRQWGKISDVPLFASKRERVAMSGQKAKAILPYVGAAFGLQMIFVMPVFLGAIYRHEWPMWAWQVFLNGQHKPGVGAILFGGYFYLLFYSGLFVVPFVLVFLWWACNSRHNEQFPKNEALMFSAWIGVTCFLFPDSVMEFIRHLPWDGPGEWLIIGWIAGGLYVVYAFGQFHRNG